MNIRRALAGSLLAIVSALGQPQLIHASGDLTRVTYYYEQGYTASGIYTAPGTIACPYELKLGTKVRILNSDAGLEDGDSYICQDRYNETWLGWRFDVWLYRYQRLYQDYFQVEIFNWDSLQNLNAP